MTKKLHVGVSPLTGTIYCGSVNKAGTGWLSNMTDVTGQACAAVAQYVLEQRKGVTVVTENGIPKWAIMVKEV